MTGCTLDIQYVLVRLGTLAPFEPLGVALLRQGHSGGVKLREATIEIVTYTDRCAAIREQLADLPAVPLPIDLPGFGL
jgi:hypothetical protein